MCLTLCDSMNRSMPSLPVHHQLLESTQTLVHWVGDSIQPSHPLLSPSPPTLDLSQHQGLFKWVSSSHQVAKVLELQLENQSYQWLFKVLPKGTQEAPKVLPVLRKCTGHSAGPMRKLHHPVDQVLLWNLVMPYKVSWRPSPASAVVLKLLFLEQICHFEHYFEQKAIEKLQR